MDSVSFCLFILITVFLQGLLIRAQTSPCPSVFQYEYNEKGWHGVITIPSPGMGQTFISVTLVTSGPIRKGFGEGLKLYKSLQETADDVDKGLDIRYWLNFPFSKSVPKVTSVQLNGKEICFAPDIPNRPRWSFSRKFIYPAGAMYTSVPKHWPQPNAAAPHSLVRPTSAPRPRSRPTPASRPPITRQGLTRVNDPIWLNNYEFSKICGTRYMRRSATHTVIRGKKIDRGEYPWLVALFMITRKHEQQYREYMCGGSLISSKYVVSAAHCTSDKKRIYMELGKYDIGDITEQGYAVRISERIIQHPEFQEQSGHADISLILIEPVMFTEKIRPICLWPYGSNLNSLRGIITGWGRDESGGEISSIPLQAEVDIVSQDECRRSDEILRNITSEYTFCAGGMKIGPCHGDSGSGFYIYKNRWYLRGIISTSIGNDYVCDVEKYAVYADVAQYLDWIKQYVM